ncbi:diguanylate cyclase domain-containing protein [Pantoea sp. 1.19]|uniref:diguanylate cyclase domain-containing protein n=1 Tax=Pantoea sp. 1.19 TaxID=1925589 RepID=UPI00094913FF|nr:diguanylate cyclase [Pantoea sp. 1.19]
MRLQHPDAGVAAAADVLERPTRRQTLNRIHLIIIAIAFLLTSGSLALLSLLALKQYAASNLQLVAESLSVSARSELLRHDAGSLQELLASLGQRGLYAEARISAVNGAVIAWRKPVTGSSGPIERCLSHWLFPAPVTVAVRQHQRWLGEVWVRGDARAICGYLWIAGVWLLGCLLIVGAIAGWLSARMHRGIVLTLRHVAAVAHDVRVRRAFSRRIPSANIAELHKLSCDFNGLLDELHGWQQHWQQENAARSWQARHDAMTGLPNRIAFEQALNKCFVPPRQLDRLALLFIDVDRFKRINDTWGHAAGDSVLVETARRLRQAVGGRGSVARLGGDEFAVLLEGEGGETLIADTARRILRAMAAPMRLLNGDGYPQTLSIGAALARDHASPGALLMQADVAMYHIKELGGGWYLSPALWERAASGAC